MSLSSMSADDIMDMRCCKSIVKFLFVAILSGKILTAGFSQNRNALPLPPDSLKLQHSMVLLGNGNSVYQHEEAREFLRVHIGNAGKKSSVVFLGNNAGRKGLTGEENSRGEEAEESLRAQLKILKDYKGNIVFVPGNRDWANGEPEGLKYVKNQRRYVEKYLKEKNIFLPPKGQPGPVEVNISKDIVLIVIDSQWWLHDYKKNYADVEDGAGFYIQLKDALDRNREKKIILAAHHPLYSFGNHGGRFPVKTNFFPLTELNKGLLIPLPGFLYTGYRKFLGGKQDLAHPNYKEFRESIEGLLRNYPDVIYVSGHDHSLQYIFEGSVHQIISGSVGTGSYTAKVASGYASSQRGISKLKFYENGDVWLEFWSIGNDNSADPGGRVYAKMLYSKAVYDKKEHKKLLKTVDYTDSLVTVLPQGVKYRKGKLKRYLMGDNYREEWMQPVTVPMFDIDNEKGGLEIIKRGGGKQTKSLRMEDKDGRQWVLRSIEKDPTTGIPDAFYMGLSAELVMDAVSSSIPYSTLCVPPIADAVGIYHTNPKIYYLPDDPRLRKYRKDLASGLYVFEERPAGNRTDVESFGRSEEIVSSLQMLEEVADNTKNYVDQPFFLKSRIIDVFINDWDRHEDQWRWATFNEGKRTKYRAIPRDRDQTFFVTEGLIYRIASQRWAYWKNQGLDYDVNDMAGLTFNARYLDRRFLNELTLEDWINTAKIMQSQLTDSVIRNAVYKMPQNVAEISGEEIIARLKARRDNLPGLAERHYLTIAKKVDVVGSNEDEQFEVERLENGETKVTVYELKRGEKVNVYYSRLFKPDETKEICLYGLEGEDKFTVTGNADKGIKIRIIGGKDKDKVVDDSKVKGLKRKTLVYDSKRNKMELGKESRDLTSRPPAFNTYDYYAFKYNKVIPLVSYGMNKEDGMFLGGGAVIQTHGFKKEPFAAKQKIDGKVAFGQNAFMIDYDGEFKSVFNGFDLNVLGRYSTPTYSQNFYGFGNETENPDSNDNYNRVRSGIFRIEPIIKSNIGQHVHVFLGTYYLNRLGEKTEGRYIGRLLNEDMLDSSILSNQQLIGINAGMMINTRDDEVFPTHGIFWESGVGYHYGVDNSESRYVKLNSEFNIYISRKKFYRAVLALRFGGALNIGDYEYFQASYIGGPRTLRGFRSNRFAGDGSLYQNTELRYRLFNFSNYISRGEIGLVGFYDSGRVWFENEESSKWHNGYGVGVWASLFDSFILRFQQEFSEEGSLLSFRFGFMY